MYVSGGASNASSSLLVPSGHLDSHPDVTFLENELVKTETFGEWALSNGVDSVDLFWLDMQGSELAALRASPDLVRRAKAIHTEVSIRSTYEGAPLYDELRAWLLDNNFEVAAEAIPPSWDMGNVLFVRRDVLNDA
jgi:hypothetical protein